jgi:nucleotide-binding universal stress UspA family protein
VPIDGSETSFRALDIALDFAQRYGSKITALYVHSRNDDPSKVEEAIKKHIEKKGVKVEIKTRSYEPSISSVANEIISEIIEGGYDLVILGARGNTANEDLIIGSVALSVVVNSAVSVMLVR